MDCSVHDIIMLERNTGLRVWWIKYMRRIVAAVMLAAMLFAANVAFAGTSTQAEPGTSRKIGLTIYLTDADGSPMKDTVVLVQRGVNAEDGYEGKTDGRGAVTIPRFPLSGFVLATRSNDDTVTGLVNVTLYPGSSTQIINKPVTAKSTVTAEELEETPLSTNINGTRRLMLSADELPVNNYEVEVSSDAKGLACLFQLESDHALLLRGVGEGEAGQIAPEPTLPPDDDDRPDDLPSAAPAPTEEIKPTATQSTPEPTAQGPTAVPDSAVSAEPTIAPTALNTASASASLEPTVTPMPETPTPDVPASTAPATTVPTAVPTEAPTPVPTSAPTTPATLVNMKLFLKDPSGNALPYYVAVLNSIAQATCNEDGEAYFTNVPTDKTNQLVVRNTNGDQVGACGLDFVEGDTTTLGSLNAGGTYTINYARGTQDVYVEIVVNVEGNAETPAVLEDVSATPLEPGVAPSEVPSEAAAPPAAATAAPNEIPGANDVIGAPSTVDAPSLSGYFSNEAGIAVPGATIRLVNEDTKNLSSSITNSQGAFGMGKLPPAHYSLNAIDPQGRNLGTVRFTVARGKRTQVKTGSDGQTYLTEASNSDTVYMDLRELSNGTVDLMYASRTPLTAPAVLTTTFSPISSFDPDASATVSADEANLAAEVEEVDIESIERPGQEQEADAGTIVFVVVLCAMGVAVAAVLIVRHARIR